MTTMNESTGARSDGSWLIKRDKRGLERLAVVDVGSNSVRMVVFDGAARSPAYFFNEKIMCGLGAELSETGRLHPEGRARALVALKRFAMLARGMQAEPIYTVATAAVREAEDGGEFCAEVLAATGLRLNVASGEEEARLSAQGVLLGWPTAKGLMCDIGGSSMELAEIADGEVGLCRSSTLGPLKLATIADQDRIQAEIRSQIDDLRLALGQEYATLFLVGGSWRAIARLDMERRKYPLKVLHEYAMTPEQALETVAWIGGHQVDELRAITGSSPERMRLVPIAARVLKELITQFAPRQIAVSSYGIREGLLYEQMPKSLRKRDPLIEACIYMERASARNPGFGKVLYQFLKPLFKGESRERQRLIKAGCLLHDVTWRAHPDYRAEVCFDNATRANLGGLDHVGRIFLGTALLHRYKNSGRGTVLEDVTAMLSDEERRAAEILGRAMRFGAMLSGASVKMKCKLQYHRVDKVLELLVEPGAADLLGEVVKTRFDNLASAMDCTTRITIL
ncbi:MAG: Ppx/GppA family phosphatase [Rhodobacteraceae bacterium]|nr:Ppx/GppA family phosphatase [Paracoccaceae bacterium]